MRDWHDQLASIVLILDWGLYRALGVGQIDVVMQSVNGFLMGRLSPAGRGWFRLRRCTDVLQRLAWYTSLNFDLGQWHSRWVVGGTWHGNRKVNGQRSTAGHVLTNWHAFVTSRSVASDIWHTVIVWRGDAWLMTSLTSADRRDNECRFNQVTWSLKAGRSCASWRTVLLQSVCLSVARCSRLTLGGNEVTEEIVLTVNHRHWQVTGRVQQEQT